jgi:hypothetical protein
MKQIKLHLPESTYRHLTEKANKQGVSIEALCVSMLSENHTLVEPPLYSSLGSKDIKDEIQKVLLSPLTNEEKSRRVRNLELQITRRIR